jgi:hypothetical protein
LAASLPRQAQKLVRLGAVLVLGELDDLAQARDRAAEIAGLERRPRLVHGSRGDSQIGLGYFPPGGVAVIDDNPAGCGAARKLGLAGRRRTRACNGDHDALDVGTRGDLVGDRAIELDAQRRARRLAGLEVDGLDADERARRRAHRFALQELQRGRLVAIDGVDRDAQLLATVDGKVARIADADVEVHLQDRAALLVDDLRIGQGRIDHRLGARQISCGQQRQRQREQQRGAVADQAHHHLP